MRLGIAAVAVLVLLSGCGGLVESLDSPSAVTTGERADDAPSSPEPESVTSTTSAPTGASGTPTAAEAATPTLAGGPDNPWNRGTVPVVVNDSANDGRNATAIAERVLAYWNAAMSRYTPYEFRFRLTDDPDEARIEVRFVESIDACDGPANHTLGCARWLRPGETPRDLEVARVVSNGSNSAVTGTAKHELGHLLGLGHDDEPAVLMAQNATRPVRDAGDRPNPWYAETLSVAVEPAAVAGDTETVEAQVGRALDFYEAGANGTVPGNVTFERTDRRHAADVVVTNDAATCDVEAGSRLALEGRNADADEALEAHTRATVCVDVDAEAVGWHVGSWLGPALGLDRDELAPAFRNASYEDRRSDWWA